MLVKELIALLKEENQELPVVIDLMEGPFDIQGYVAQGQANRKPVVWITPLDLRKD